jgi:hypothetical protein
MVTESARRKHDLHHLSSNRPFWALLPFSFRSVPFLSFPPFSSLLFSSPSPLPALPHRSGPSSRSGTLASNSIYA